MAGTKLPSAPNRSGPARRLARRLSGLLERLLSSDDDALETLILIATTALAFGWANSPWSSSYQRLWQLPITVGVGRLVSSQSLHFWINDGLMTIFFLFIGLEIRGELHDGHLSTLKGAALPVAAALGGMLAPALIYLGLNIAHPALRVGWGVPTATDIAFALGVLALLGKRIPPGLRVFLLAIAIIDDIGAIVIIAVFYSDGISLTGLATAGAGVLLILGFQRGGVRRPLAYLAPGLVVWIGTLYAGIHPTIAGVAIGLLTPARWAPEQHGVPKAASERVRTALQPWVAYAVMPLFALANAGVDLRGLEPLRPGSATITLGVMAGLVLGKPAGILFASVISVKLRVSTLPRGVRWLGVLTVGCLAGIGFTMAIFIAGLAFSHPSLLATAKLAILLASASAAVLGLIVGRVALPAPATHRRGETARRRGIPKDERIPTLGDGQPPAE
jgi:NhaA family Na+:H+ antiporter